jgi:hypothetical protein
MSVKLFRCSPAPNLRPDRTRGTGAAADSAGARAWIVRVAAIVEAAEKSSLRCRARLLDPDKVIVE